MSNIKPTDLAKSYAAFIQEEKNTQENKSLNLDNKSLAREYASYSTQKKKEEEEQRIAKQQKLNTTINNLYEVNHSPKRRTYPIVQKQVEEQQKQFEDALNKEIVNITAWASLSKESDYIYRNRENLALENLEKKENWRLLDSYDNNPLIFDSYYTGKVEGMLFAEKSSDNGYGPLTKVTEAEALEYIAKDNQKDALPNSRNSRIEYNKPIIKRGIERTRINRVYNKKNNFDKNISISTFADIIQKKEKNEPITNYEAGLIDGGYEYVSEKVFGEIFYRENGITVEDYLKNRVEEIKSELKELQHQAGQDVYFSVSQWEMSQGAPKFLATADASAAEAVIEKPFDDLLEEITNWEENSFASGFDESFDWLSILSVGVVDLVNGVLTHNAVKRAYNEDKLSPYQQAIVKMEELKQELYSFKNKIYEQQSLASSIGSGLGSTVSAAPGFIIGMGATRSILPGVKYGSDYAAKRFIANKTVGNAANLALQGSKDLVKWSGKNYAKGAVAATLNPAFYTGVTKEYISQYSFNEDGSIKYTPKNDATMWASAYIDQVNEFASEYYGAGFSKAFSAGARVIGRALGITKVFNNSSLGTWIRRAGQTPVSAATKQFFRDAGYTGVVADPMSEVFGDFMSQAMRRGIGAEYDFNQFSDPNYWKTTMAVSALYGGALTTIGGGVEITKAANQAKKLYNDRETSLKNIKSEELRNKVQILGNSENFDNSAVELANINWKRINPADKANAINYMRISYVLQAVMGDIEGQKYMSSYANRAEALYEREFLSQKGERTGLIYTVVDNKGKVYNAISANSDAGGNIIEWNVLDENGNSSTIKNSDVVDFREQKIEDIITDEFQKMFSSEIESERLNNIRQAFEKINNPSEKDIRIITSEFDIRKPIVGNTVTLVDGTEATIKEDLNNGNYTIDKFNTETGELKTIEIPVYSILSNNPITAAAQKKIFEVAKLGYENNDSSAIQQAYESSEDKVNNIINEDYNSKLFDDEGVVKLNAKQIINTFSFEDPSSLEDYINKLGDKVPQQTKQHLTEALKLSKIHNEITSKLYSLAQTNKNKVDIALLDKVLKSSIISSDPNISAETLLESIINNKDFNSEVIHDFENILASLRNSNVQKKTTTKTKTSVTQEDVKGKKGRKTIESSLKRFRQVVKQDNIVKTLYEISFIDETRKKTNDIIITDEELKELEEARKTFKERGYEIKPLKGTNYHEGQNDTLVEEFIKDPNLPVGTAIVTDVITPAIYKDGQLYKAGKVKVAIGPEAEEETPDISQAVTKEMTENEPIDLFKPTDSTVESKKEDSITQDTTEQEFTIPELEKVFAVPDSDKLIETPSREEEVETLTDEQRSQVRIHNENSTDLVDYISDSTLPDDSSTDEVIVDKHELQGNRIYRYNGEQLRNNQAQVRRTPNKGGDNHDLVYKWLDENSIDLQGIIDNELADIAALDTDVKFMMMTGGTKSGYSVGSPMLNTVFQVVEYTDAIRKIHNEKRGGVITSNGKEYLLIGITGFSTSKPGIFNPEAAHYNFIADKVLKSARNNYTSQTDEISREAYYVHPTMSTKIKNIEAGWIVTQTTEDSEKQSRSLGELLADETRNPHGITTENSKWLIPTRNSAKPIKVRVDANDTVHGLKIPTGLAGSLFLLVPASNGHYIPVSVKIQTTNKLVDGTLKDTIWEVAQNLLSTEKETRDYTIKELCKLLNLTKEGYNIFVDDSEIDFDNPNSAKIVFTQNGRRMATEIPLNSPNASAELYNTIFSNIPFQLNIGLQTLVSGELQAYIDAGALITDIALLGTTNASYTIHSIGPDLKEDPYTENSADYQEGSYENSDLRRTQDNGLINYGNNSYFRMAEDQYVNIKTGEPVTDVKTIREIKIHVWLEKSKPTPAKIEQSSKAKLYIVGENEVISVSKKGIITFYSMERSGEIINEINRENIEESRINNAVEELARIEEQQQVEQAIPQELQEEKEASIPEVNFTENFDMFNTPEISPVEDSFTEASFEETPILKEKVSATFTEGVVENTDASQLYTDDYLVNIEEQLIAEGISEEEINAFMDKVLLQLKEHGMDTYYTKDQENKIKTIVDNIKNCH